jgi:hypothetical protein
MRISQRDFDGLAVVAFVAPSAQLMRSIRRQNVRDGAAAALVAHAVHVVVQGGPIIGMPVVVVPTPQMSDTPESTRGPALEPSSSSTPGRSSSHEDDALDTSSSRDANLRYCEVCCDSHPTDDFPQLDGWTQEPTICGAGFAAWL